MEAKHTNRLVHETSPYLLQHAHNPVDWYPWGEEALNRAKQEDRAHPSQYWLFLVSLVPCDGERNPLRMRPLQRS